ncbi:MAG: hypothetical protein AAFY56_18130 [Pseudomonadota bacterium]
MRFEVRRISPATRLWAVFISFLASTGFALADPIGQDPSDNVGEDFFDFAPVREVIVVTGVPIANTFGVFGSTFYRIPPERREQMLQDLRDALDEVQVELDASCTKAADIAESHCVALAALDSAACGTAGIAVGIYTSSVITPTGGAIAGGITTLACGAGGAIDNHNCGNRTGRFWEEAGRDIIPLGCPQRP